MYFANDKEKRAFIAECLEYFRRPVGPDYILKNMNEYTQYLNYVVKNIDTISKYIYHDKTKDINLAKRSILAILIIICCCLCGAVLLLSLTHIDSWWAPLLLFTLQFIMFICYHALEFCHDNILCTKKASFNIYRHIKDYIFAFNKNGLYNSKLSETCVILALKNNSSEDFIDSNHTYSIQIKYEHLLNICPYLIHNKLIFVIFSEAERLAKKYNYLPPVELDFEDEVFLNLPHNEIINKYKEELNSKDKVPIPVNLFSQSNVGNV